MYADGLEAALALPPDAVGPALAAIAEDQWFDRKSIRIKPQHLAVDLIAFANAEGGTIIIGVSQGEIEGVRAYSKQVNAMRQAPIDFTRPPVRARFQEVPVVNRAGDPDALFVVRVAPGEAVHELPNGDAYLRVGDESRKLGFVQRQELHYDRGSAPFDGGVASGVAVSDVQGKHLDAYRELVVATGTDESLLQARSLLTHSGELTVAGYLLFHPHPQHVFPNAHVRVLRFAGDERGTGSRLTLRDSDDVRINGPIPDVIHDAANVIEDWVPKRRALRASGLFEPVPIIPRDAWLEGLVNAVVHRSYSNIGDHVRVEIYPNRIEIESPGRFPGLIDPNQPDRLGRFARNPRIARVCSDMRIGQELGEGIPRIFDEMRTRGLAEPRWHQSATSVRLVLDGSPGIAASIARTLPSGSTDLLDLLRDARRPLGTGELMELSGLSRPTVRRQLGALQEVGLVEWVGLSPQDPRATWRLVMASHGGKSSPE